MSLGTISIQLLRADVLISRATEGSSHVLRNIVRRQPGEHFRRLGSH